MIRLARAIAACVAAVSLFAVTPSHASALTRPCASGAIHVALVVDFGSSGSVDSACVPASSGMTDAAVLGLRHSVKYSDSTGLLCSIDGVPKTGCADRNGTHYDMWSYWHGENGKWVYANDNFGTRLASEDVVIGWRWTPGANGNATDPPPNGSASATAICPPAPPTPQGNPSPAPGGNANAPGGNPTANGKAPAQGTPPSANAATATTAPATTSVSAVKSTHPPGSSATTFDALGASASARPHGGSSSGPPIGLFVGLALIAALATGGVIVARRRRATT